MLMPIRFLILLALLLPLHPLLVINAAAFSTEPARPNRCQKVLPPSPLRPASIAMTSLPPAVVASIQKIDDLITTDAGGRGMKHLVVPGDLLASAEILARPKPLPSRDGSDRAPRAIVLTGFPCCVDRDPPTETDGLASVAIARAATKLGHEAVLVTESCNEAVFRAAVDGEGEEEEEYSSIRLVFFPSGSSWTAEHDGELKELADSADLVVACERAGPAADGNCYTMRGINMNERGLIAPLHDIVTYASENGAKFVAIGDGGNELGMGKVIDEIYERIPDGRKIGAVTAADHLVAASVSNWGGYALMAAAALVAASDRREASNEADERDERAKTKGLIDECLPTEEAETRLLRRCVAAGCRDGVSGRTEATVDGMPLERSMECLREIRRAALGE